MILLTNKEFNGFNFRIETDPDDYIPPVKGVWEGTIQVACTKEFKEYIKALGFFGDTPTEWSVFNYCCKNTNLRFVWWEGRNKLSLDCIVQKMTFIDSMEEAIKVGRQVPNSDCPCVFIDLRLNQSSRPRVVG